MLFGFFCYGVFRWGLKRRPLLLLILGLACHAVVSVLYSASLLGNGFSSGDSISVLWLVGFGCMSWGAYEYRLVRETIAIAGNRKAGRRIYVFDRLMHENGSASGRERGGQYGEITGVAVSVKKNNQEKKAQRE